MQSNSKEMTSKIAEQFQSQPDAAKKKWLADYLALYYCGSHIAIGGPLPVLPMIIWDDRLLSLTQIISVSYWPSLLPGLEFLIQEHISYLNWDTRRNADKDRKDAEMVVHLLLQSIFAHLEKFASRGEEKCFHDEH